MSNIEEKPLHEVILDIMYFKNTEKPMFFSPEDIFWQMKDPNISERQITEVLDWLVINKKAEKRFGKYQIDKYEFIDLSNKYKQDHTINDSVKDTETPTKVEVVKKVSISKPRPPKKTRRKPIKKRLPKVFWLLGIVFFILLGYVGYRLYTTPTYSFSKVNLKTSKVYIPQELYVPIQSTDDDKDATRVLEEQMQNISYSFVKQNKTNKAVTYKLNEADSNILRLQNEFNKLNNSYQQERANVKIVFACFLGLFVVVLLLFITIFRK